MGERIKDNSSKSAEMVEERFAEYLNDLMGKSLLETMDKGSNFILQTSDHIFRITKKSGTVVVELLEINGET